jgi:hypothetical protein
MKVCKLEDMYSTQRSDIVTCISNIILSVGQHRVESELMYKKSDIYKDD